MDDVRDGLDAIQADMADHQRERSRTEVTAESNRALAAQTFERLAREAAEAKAVPVTPTATAPPEGTTRREVDGKSYLVNTATEDDIPLATATPEQIRILGKMDDRTRLLMSKRESGPLGSPSWRDRLLAVFAWKDYANSARASKHFDVADVYADRFELEFTELLNASDATFGPWLADAPTKVMIG